MEHLNRAVTRLSVPHVQNKGSTGHRAEIASCITCRKSMGVPFGQSKNWEGREVGKDFRIQREKQGRVPMQGQI